MALFTKPQPNYLVDYNDWQAQGAPVVEAVKAYADTPAQDLLAVSERATEIQIEFPVFADGRAFSLARLLRRNGYQGTIRAVGDVAVDRAPYMQRVGFDAIDLKEGEDAAVAERNLGIVTLHYQSSADQFGPVYVSA